MPLSFSLFLVFLIKDEMGLGKTVELLACILAHRRPSMEAGYAYQNYTHSIKMEPKIKRQKRERVECICGAASESSKYTGLWVQCDFCDAWQHAKCVGYFPKKNCLTSHENGSKDAFVNGLSKSKRSRKYTDTSIKTETDEDYICSLCSELIQAVKIDIYSNATLIVCPAPILAQWESEILRYVFSFVSLNLCVYCSTCLCVFSMATAVVHNFFSEILFDKLLEDYNIGI